MLSGRRVPLEPERSYDVLFAPELVHELHGLAEMDDVVMELEQVLSQNIIAGRRVGKIDGRLHKYRPHAANDIRFLFATIEDQKARVVLSYFPRKHDYRKKDVTSAAERLHRFLDSMKPGPRQEGP